MPCSCGADAGKSLVQTRQFEFLAFRPCTNVARHFQAKNATSLDKNATPLDKNATISDTWCKTCFLPETVIFDRKRLFLTENGYF